MIGWLREILSFPFSTYCGTSISFMIELYERDDQVWQIAKCLRREILDQLIQVGSVWQVKMRV